MRDLCINTALACFTLCAFVFALVASAVFRAGYHAGYDCGVRYIKAQILEALELLKLKFQQGESVDPMEIIETIRGNHDSTL